MSKRLLILTFIAIIVVGALHQIGSAFFLYWSIEWFDMMMHLLGGFSMGLLFLWTWNVSGIFGKKLPSKSSALVGALLFVIAISVAWEIFEYAFDIANPVGGNYATDTVQDIIADLIGGTLAGLVGSAKKLYE